MMYESFARAVRDPHAPPPHGAIAWNRSNVAPRFAVYRNNVAVSLVEALCANFPVCMEIAGVDFFRAMARVFIARHPPSSRLLCEYGRDFPDFVRAFEHASSMPYLPDVARLEAARTSAYHAADARALVRADFARIDARSLADLRFVFHPATRVVRARFAVASIWAAHRGGGAIESVDPFVAEDALVTRPVFEVETHRLSPGGGVFLDSLSSGRTLGDAASHAAQEPGFDLADAIGILIVSGAVASLEAGGTSQ